jgi:hypothetical protein
MIWPTSVAVLPWDIGCYPRKLIVHTKLVAGGVLLTFQQSLSLLHIDPTWRRHDYKQ